MIKIILVCLLIIIILYNTMYIEPFLHIDDGYPTYPPIWNIPTRLPSYLYSYPYYYYYPSIYNHYGYTYSPYWSQWRRWWRW